MSEMISIWCAFYQNHYDIITDIKIDCDLLSFRYHVKSNKISSLISNG